MANLSAKKLQQLFALLPKELKAPILAETFRQAELLRGSMRLKAHIGKGDDPHKGALRDSIRVEKGRGEMRVLVRAGGPKTTVSGSGRLFGLLTSSSYDYANAQEFGTRRMSAQPFFWPSYRERKKSIRKAMKAAATSAIKANWRD